LRRVADAVRPTQTDPGTFAGPRLLGPDGRYEHVPLRFVRVSAADVDALSAAAAALGEPVRSAAVTDALHLHAGYRAGDRGFRDPVAALVARVLDLEWTRDAELLRARLEPAVANTVGDAAVDVVLTRADETAYQRVVTRFTRVDSRGPGRQLHLLTAEPSRRPWGAGYRPAVGAAPPRPVPYGHGGPGVAVGCLTVRSARPSVREPGLPVS